MHLIVPFAGVRSEAGLQALRTLKLPHLRRQLARLTATDRDRGDEMSLTPPHERALAAALGWRGDDGALPWAAWRAAADGIDPGQRPWALLTPVHQHVGTEQVSLADPEALALGDAASRELFDLVRPLFDSEGFTLAWGAALRWYASHESLAALACASLDRVIGRHIGAWLPRQRESRLLRRLQNEVQMLLYTQAFNDRREAAGLPTVNSFWISGCGVAQPCAAPAPVVDERLRTPALNEDWPAWTQAWQALDDGPLARDGWTTITLAGERDAQRFEARPAGWWTRAQRAFRPADPTELLESL